MYNFCLFLWHSRQFTELKSKNPDLKTLLSIGGEHGKAEEFRSLIATENSRSTFASSAASFLTSRDFDGLDVDWEYPEAQDRDKFALFLKVS